MVFCTKMELKLNHYMINNLYKKRSIKLSKLGFVKIWIGKLCIMPLKVIKKDEWTRMGSTINSDGDFKCYINEELVTDCVTVRKINKWKLWEGDLQLATLKDVFEKFEP